MVFLPSRESWVDSNLRDSRFLMTTSLQRLFDRKLEGKWLDWGSKKNMHSMSGKNLWIPLALLGLHSNWWRLFLIGKVLDERALLWQDMNDFLFNFWMCCQVMLLVTEKVTFLYERTFTWMYSRVFLWLMDYTQKCSRSTLSSHLPLKATQFPTHEIILLCVSGNFLSSREEERSL